MDLSQAIAIASKPDAYEVCGIPLRPYCIGHWLHLTRLDAAFVSGNDCGLGDLIVGLLVCSKTYEEFSASLDSGSLYREIPRMQHRISGGFRGVWKRRFRSLFQVRDDINDALGFDFTAAASAFMDYIEQHGGGQWIVNDWSVPRMWKQSDKPTRATSVPGFMVLLDALTCELGCSQSEALNMPLPLGRWRWAIHAERTGLSSIYDPEKAAQEKAEADEYARKVFSGEIAV